MKKIITLAALGLLIAAPMSAQTVYDAAKITNKDLNGTARFVGMGGAMGALKNYNRSILNTYNHRDIKDFRETKNWK